MSYAVKTLPTGDTATTGTVIPPVLGAVDIWDGIWAAAPHHGQTDRYLKNHGGMTGLKPWETQTVFQPDLSTGDPRITFGAGHWMVAQNAVPAVSDHTSLFVIDVRGHSADTLRTPGARLHLMGSGPILRTGSGDTAVPGVPSTGKHVWVIVRRGGDWEVWRDGRRLLSHTGTAQSDRHIGLWPAGSGLDLDFYQARYAARALTDAQIVAASADARTLHGI